MPRDGAIIFGEMPVVLRESPELKKELTPYCGLLNGKNSYGGYVGFYKFFAFLRKDSKGHFVSGELRLMASPAFDPVSEGKAEAADDICSQYGYTDFSNAR